MVQGWTDTPNCGIQWSTERILTYTVNILGLLIIIFFLTKVTSSKENKIVY